MIRNRTRHVDRSTDEPAPRNVLTRATPSKPALTADGKAL
jgi:hypothetical protein